MNRIEADSCQEREERLGFENLLGEISARYVYLPADQIDIWIEEDQRRICECLGFDVSVLWQWSGETSRFLTVTHMYSPPQGPSRPEGIDAQKSFPWSFKKVLMGETFILTTRNMPPEAARDQETLRYFGIKSSVVLPLSAGGGPLLGVLSFDSMQEEGGWSAEIVTRLALVAQIFTNALIRKESDRILRANKERLSLAADSAGAGLWELNCSTNLIWATEKALAIFGYAPGEVINMARFEATVCPEDLEHVRQAIARSLENNEPFSIEYRILVDGDCLKWVYASGRPYFKPNGERDRLLGVLIDITERKAIEAQRNLNQERLASAIDIAALGFYEMGENHHIRFLDDRMRELVGLPPESEADARQFWLEHIYEEDLEGVQDVVRKVLEKGVNHFTVEYRYRHPMHGLLWLNHLSRALKRDAAGRATRVIGVIQDITERKLMEERLKKSEVILRNNQRDLQRLAGGLIAVKEEELRRLSRELHDDLTQRLAVIAIEAGKLELQMKTMEPPLGESIGKIAAIKEQLIKVSEDVHRISRQLHPTILEDLGLIRAIESECAVINQMEHLEIIFRQDAIPGKIPKDVALCLYRIIQEGLKNAITHASAQGCEILLQGLADTVHLTMRDDGMGFDPDEVRHKPGLGLSSMRERVLLVQGDFSIDTRPGCGTVISVSIPLNGEVI
jgi:PAS domain S-box-containing protein